jgi:four helix bundle protein
MQILFRLIRSKRDAKDERRKKKNDHMLNLAHKKLDVWKKSLILVAEVYKLTQSFPREEQFGLTSQLRRASVSVISNIAEGFARSSELETKRFLEIARSSLVEVDTQIEIALKLNYLTEKDIIGLAEGSNHIFAMLTKLIKKFLKV